MHTFVIWLNDRKKLHEQSMYIPELSSSYNGHALHVLFYSSGHQIKLVDGALKVNVHLIHHVDNFLLFHGPHYCYLMRISRRFPLNRPKYDTPRSLTKQENAPNWNHVLHKQIISYFWRVLYNKQFKAAHACRRTIYWRIQYITLYSESQCRCTHLFPLTANT